MSDKDIIPEDLLAVRVAVARWLDRIKSLEESPSPDRLEAALAERDETIARLTEELERRKVEYDLYITQIAAKQELAHRRIERLEKERSELREKLKVAEVTLNHYALEYGNPARAALDKLRG